MKQILLVLFVLLTIASSCRKAEELPSLPGTWQEVNEPPGFGGSVYRITFTEEGNFRLKKSIWTDMIDIGHPCNNSREQYARGSYTATGTMLSLTGKYCDSMFTADVPDCSMGVDFHELHTMAGTGDWLILDDERDIHYRIYLSRE